MKESSSTIDQLFHGIISDLANDIVSHTQTAAESTINLSSRFLDSDSQSLISDFQTLYTHHDDQALAHAQHLGSVKKGIKKIVNKETSIRAEINVVVGAMQFAELLRQHLEGVLSTFAVLIENIDKSHDDLGQMMLAELHTHDDRVAFYKHVLKQDMPQEDAEIDQDLIDQLIG